MTTGPLAFLRAAHDAAEAVAQEAFDGSWQAVDTPFGPTVRTGEDGEQWSREGQRVDAAYRCDDPHDTCADARRSYLAEARLIAAHANPAAVLRRIATERKMIAALEAIDADPDYNLMMGKPVDTDPLWVALAEGWGWTPGT